MKERRGRARLRPLITCTRIQGARCEDPRLAHHQMGWRAARMDPSPPSTRGLFPSGQGFTQQKATDSTQLIAVVIAFSAEFPQFSAFCSLKRSQWDWPCLAQESKIQATQPMGPRFPGRMRVRPPVSSPSMAPIAGGLGILEASGLRRNCGQGDSTNQCFSSECCPPMMGVFPSCGAGCVGSPGSRAPDGMSTGFTVTGVRNSTVTVDCSWLRLRGDRAFGLVVACEVCSSCTAMIK